MAITLKKITLWRKEVDNKPGALADTRCDRRCSFIVQGAPRGSQAQSCPFPDNARRERRLPRFGLTPFSARAPADGRQYRPSRLLACWKLPFR